MVAALRVAGYTCTVCAQGVKAYEGALGRAQIQLHALLASALDASDG